MLLNLGLTVSLLVGGAAAALPGGGDRPVVVTTMSIWADIVDRADCVDRFDVQTLVPAGGDPHSYEPSMRDRDTLADAALVVANGADLEEQLHDTLETVAGEGTTVFEVAEHVTTRPMGTDEHAADESAGDESESDDEHAHDGDDPHVWFDPTLIVEALPALGGALVDAGADTAETATCIDALTEELGALDEEISQVVSTIPPERRLLVTNHDALGYFADRYGFEIIGSVLPSSSTLVEASPSELDDLADAIADAGVPAIFAEALESTDDATTLGDRLGVDVVTLYTDSLGEEGSGAETYGDMMLFDANAIATALGGGSENDSA